MGGEPRSWIRGGKAAFLDQGRRSGIPGSGAEKRHSWIRGGEAGLLGTPSLQAWPSRERIGLGLQPLGFELYPAGLHTTSSRS